MVRIDADGIATGVDEISNYQDIRCIGASEACWRLLEFDMYDRSPREGGDEDEARRHQERAAALPPTTELTEWMAYVQKGGAPDDRDGPWKQLT
eukprot:2417585-Prymnesium_polylepis.1